MWEVICNVVQKKSGPGHRNIKDSNPLDFHQVPTPRLRKVLLERSLFKVHIFSNLKSLQQNHLVVLGKNQAGP